MGGSFRVSSQLPRGEGANGHRRDAGPFLASASSPRSSRRKIGVSAVACKKNFWGDLAREFDGGVVVKPQFRGWNGREFRKVFRAAGR